MSDDEHRDLMKWTKASGFENYSDFVRHLIERDAEEFPVRPIQDPIRPENRSIHQRFEALWNSLNESERNTLVRKLSGAEAPRRLKPALPALSAQSRELAS
jgi:hypothetical protein